MIARQRVGRKRRKKTTGGVPAGRKVVVEFPGPLLERIERAAAELATDRSKFICSAVERYLEVIRQRQLEQELAGARPKGEAGPEKDSVILCNQVRTVDESRFGTVLGNLRDATMARVDQALKISLGLP